MEREDRLNKLITGETVEVCENCRYYVIDKLDPQGVGGYCGKDGDFCFCFEYCKEYKDLRE